MTLKRLTWVAAACILAVTALFGGLQAADHVTAVSLGQTYDDGPLRITPHSVKLTDQMPGFPDLPAQCRYLVMTATITNDADRAVSFGTAMTMLPSKPCKLSPDVRGAQPFEIDGAAATFVGSVRTRDGTAMPEAAPGFTDDYVLIWVIPTASLDNNPVITIRMFQMSRYISTFRIDSDWGADPKRYGALQLHGLETS